jgi:hypothetical protein
MGLSSGPNNANLGLVFAYDTGDTVNSYIGEPTVNIAAGLGLVPVALDPVTYVGIEDGWLKYSLGGTWSSGTYPYAFALTPVTFTGGLPYCVRATVKTNVLSKFNYFGSSGISYVNEPKNYEGTLSSTLNPDGSYTVTRYDFAYTNTTAQAGYLFTNPVNGATFNSATDFVWIKDYQAEQKNHPTQYVNGTRSVTQGLLPLTGSTINLTDVSFNSSAQIVFDGTNDRILLDPVLAAGAGQYTIEAIFKANSIKTQVVWEQNSSTVIQNERACMLLLDNGLGGFNGQANDYHSVIPYTTGVWYHWVIVINKAGGGNSVELYNNGSLYSEGNPSNGGQNLNVGNYASSVGYKLNANSEYFDGQVAVVRIYNRALNATEIQNNYLNYKTRFNLS